MKLFSNIINKARTALAAAFAATHETTLVPQREYVKAVPQAPANPVVSATLKGLPFSAVMRHCRNGFYVAWAEHAPLCGPCPSRPGAYRAALRNYHKMLASI